MKSGENRTLRVQLKPFTFRVLWIRSSAMLPKLVSIPKINFCKKTSISHGSSYLHTFPKLSSWPHQSTRKNKLRAPDINKEPTIIINWFVHLMMMMMMIILPLLLLLFLCNSQLWVCTSVVRLQCLVQHCRSGCWWVQHFKEQWIHTCMAIKIWTGSWIQKKKKILTPTCPQTHNHTFKWEPATNFEYENYFASSTWIYWLKAPSTPSFINPISIVNNRDHSWSIHTIPKPGRVGIDQIWQCFFNHCPKLEWAAKK